MRNPNAPAHSTALLLDLRAKRLVLGLWLALIAGLSTGAAMAAPIDTKHFKDPVLETRYRALIAELRCLVCQNQSLSESDADLAKDLRNIVKSMLRDGKSDEQVKTYMVDRYGDFVLYRPPFKPLTWLLWGAPFILFLIGVALLIRRARNRPDNDPAAKLAPGETAALHNLLNDDSSSKT